MARFALFKLHFIFTLFCVCPALAQNYETNTFINSYEVDLVNLGPCSSELNNGSLLSGKPQFQDLLVNEAFAHMTQDLFGQVLHIYIKLENTGVDPILIDALYWRDNPIDIIMSNEIQPFQNFQLNGKTVLPLNTYDQHSIILKNTEHLKSGISLPLVLRFSTHQNFYIPVPILSSNEFEKMMDGV